MVLNVEQLWKTFPIEGGSQPVLQGVSLSLAAGQMMALTGESGSGKSTLLHLVAGLDQADKGQITVAGRDVTASNDQARAEMRRDTVSLVFQQFNLIPSLTVGENLEFQARLAGRHDPDWSASLAARLGLDDYLGRYPEALSGGQQQRVAVGRALAARPRLILADEPTGNLDQATGDAVLGLMREMVQETGAALLMVTHSVRLADQLDLRLHLKAGQLS